MSAVTRPRRSTDGFERVGVSAVLRRASVHHLAVRAAIVVGAATTLGSTMAAIGSGQPVAFVIVAVLALGCALSTDGHVVLLTTLVLAVNWLTAVDDTTTVWVVPAGLGLLVLHTAAAAVTIAPPAARFERATVRRWARRTATVGAVVPVAWAGTALLDGWSDSGQAVLLVAALVALATTASWVRSRSVTSG